MIRSPHSDGRSPTGAAGGQGRGASGPAAALAASLDGPRSSAGYAASQNADLDAPIDFDHVRKQVPLTAILSRYGILNQLKPSGRRLIGPCPIHHGSGREFVVDTTSNTWFCFSPRCDRGGGSLELVALIENTDTTHAARSIAGWFALSAPLSPRSRERNTMTEKTNPNRPTHKVLAAEQYADGDETKTYYTRVGSAWPIKSGKGLSISLTALPVNGRLVVLEFDDEDAAPPRAKANT